MISGKAETPTGDLMSRGRGGALFAQMLSLYVICRCVGGGAASQQAKQCLKCGGRGQDKCWGPAHISHAHPGHP